MHRLPRRGGREREQVPRLHPQRRLDRARGALDRALVRAQKRFNDDREALLADRLRRVPDDELDRLPAEDLPKRRRLHRNAGGEARHAELLHQRPPVGHRDATQGRLPDAHRAEIQRAAAIGPEVPHREVRARERRAKLERSAQRPTRRRHPHRRRQMSRGFCRFFFTLLTRRRSGLVRVAVPPLLEVPRARLGGILLGLELDRERRALAGLHEQVIGHGVHAASQRRRHAKVAPRGDGAAVMHDELLAVRAPDRARLEVDHLDAVQVHRERLGVGPEGDDLLRPERRAEEEPRVERVRARGGFRFGSELDVDERRPVPRDDAVGGGPHAPPGSLGVLRPRASDRERERGGVFFFFVAALFSVVGDFERHGRRAVVDELGDERRALANDDARKLERRLRDAHARRLRVRRERKLDDARRRGQPKRRLDGRVGRLRGEAHDHLVAHPRGHLPGVLVLHLERAAVLHVERHHAKRRVAVTHVRERHPLRVPLTGLEIAKHDPLARRARERVALEPVAAHRRVRLPIQARRVRRPAPNLARQARVLDVENLPPARPTLRRARGRSRRTVRVQGPIQGPIQGPVRVQGPIRLRAETVPTHLAFGIGRGGGSAAGDFARPRRHPGVLARAVSPRAEARVPARLVLVPEHLDARGGVVGAFEPPERHPIGLRQQRLERRRVRVPGANRVEARAFFPRGFFPPGPRLARRLFFLPRGELVPALQRRVHEPALRVHPERFPVPRVVPPRRVVGVAAAAELPRLARDARRDLRLARLVLASRLRLAPGPPARLVPPEEHLVRVFSPR